jgi:hypothetical protein
MADPAMDRQEFYVAASRTRGETFLYATPEVGFDRIEFAPNPPSAEGLEYIARAAERDGSQAAAHDAALREQLGRLSTEELYARRRELASEAGAEGRNEHNLEDLERRFADAKELRERFAGQPEELGAEPPIWARADRAAYREEQAKAEERQRYAEAKVTEVEAEVASAARVEHAARAERAATEHLIEERIGARLVAVRIDPPDYLTRELGERPADPTKRWAWDRAVAGIERYRQEHSIRDRDSALGAKPGNRAQRLEREATLATIRLAQRSFGMEQAHAIEAADLGIEL